MERKTLEAMLPEGTDKEVVTKVLDALHAEIGPYKEAAQKAEADLAEKIKEIGEISKKAKNAEEAQNALADLQEKYEPAAYSDQRKRRPRHRSGYPISGSGSLKKQQKQASGYCNRGTDCSGKERISVRRTPNRQKSGHWPQIWERARSICR